jgi:hypothetical protein
MSKEKQESKPETATPAEVKPISIPSNQLIIKGSKEKPLTAIAKPQIYNLGESKGD